MWWLIGFGVGFIVLGTIFSSVDQRIGKFLAANPMKGLNYSVVNDAEYNKSPANRAGYPRFYGIVFQNYSSFFTYINRALTLPELRPIRTAMRTWIVCNILIYGYLPIAFIIWKVAGAVYK